MFMAKPKSLQETRKTSAMFGTFSPYSFSPYSIDAICMGSLSCAESTPPRAIPTKNIAANITAIAPSFRGGLSLPICLSKSSWSVRSILMSPFLFIGNVCS
jgi:hypothetical protein